jgi:copper homeostasis protein
VTPSIGLIEQAATVIGGRDVALHALIRPRAGGFDYSDDEFDIIQRDIIAAKVAGADGELQQRHF